MTNRLVAALVVCGALMIAAPAQANVTAPEETLALLERSAMPVVDDQTVVVGPCPDAETARTANGCTYMTPDASVYLLPEVTGAWAVVYHEFGHRFDFTAMTTRTHVRFAGLVGKSWRAGAKWGPWLQERFADAYAMCARNRERLVEDDTIRSWPISRRTHQRMCLLIEGAGVRAGLA